MKQHGRMNVVLILIATVCALLCFMATNVDAVTCTSNQTIEDGACVCAPGHLMTNCNLPSLASLTFGDGRFYIEWAMIDSATVRIRTVASTSQWWGWIINTGWDGMTGGDCWTFYIDSSGVVYAQDRYSTGTSTPPLDGQQDLTSVSGRYNGTHTIVEFSRKLITNDENDQQFTVFGETDRYMWTLGNGDNKRGGGSNLGKHDFLGSTGQLRIAWSAGIGVELTDGVEWPDFYWAALIGAGVILVGGLIAGRTLFQTSLFGRYVNRPIIGARLYKQWTEGSDNSSCMNTVTLGVFPALAALTWLELCYVGIYVAIIAKGCVASQSQYSYVGRSWVYVSGHIYSVHMAALLLPVTRTSMFLPLFGIGYDSALKWHRRLGAATFIFCIIHLSSMLTYWSTSVLFETNASQFGLAPLYGTLCGVATLILFLTSFECVRRQAWHIFFLTHIICFPLAFVFALLHSMNLRWLCIVPGSLWIMDWCARLYRAYGRKAQINSIQIFDKDAERAVICVSCQVAGFKPSPGAHVFINIPSISSWWNFNPFTVATCGEGIGAPFELYIQVTHAREGSFTARLAHLANEWRQTPNHDPVKLYVDGPYPMRALPLQSPSYQRIILVAGGVGITPIISLLSSYIAKASGELASKEPIRRRVCLIWTNRGHQALHSWFPTLFARIAAFPPYAFELHLYNTNSSISIGHNNNINNNHNNNNNMDRANGSRTNSIQITPTQIVVREVDAKQPHPPSSLPPAHEDKPLVVHSGRPNLEQIFTTFTSTDNDNGRVSGVVLACGPPSLIRTAQSLASQVNLHFAEESFHF